MMVLQYSFIALLWYPNYLHPSYYFMQGLKYSAGYNYPFYELVPSNTPPQISTFSLSNQYFLGNMNIVLLLPLIPILPLIFYLYNYKKSLDPSNIEKYEEKLDYCFDRALYCSFFNLAYLLNSLVIFYSYGETTDPGNHVVSILAIVFTLGMWVLFVAFPGSSGRFRSSFYPT